MALYITTVEDICSDRNLAKTACTLCSDDLLILLLSDDSTDEWQELQMIAEKKGYKREDVEQRLGDDIIIYPSCYVSPCKTIRYPEAFACHQVYGSWLKRRFGRKIERFLKHICLVVRFALFKR